MNPVLIDKDCGIIAGHGRVEAAKREGITEVPCVWVEHLTEAQKKAYILADNRLAEDAGWDEEMLSVELEELKELNFDIGVAGFEGDEWTRKTDDSAKVDEAKLTLQQQFLIFPSTIMDTRTGVWLERKRAWKNIGIKSEVGRGADDDKSADGLTFAKSAQTPAVYKAKNEYEDKIGRAVSWDEFSEEYPDVFELGGTSIFDPVLCEVIYRWFCPQNGKILDPFAGGSVRGVVASILGKNYTGVDLSERQINANVENWKEISSNFEDVKQPNWIIGDSTNIEALAQGEYDLIFSCPPYGDLEVYSNKEEDLSNKDYPDFLVLYEKIISSSIKMLKNNRFACFVVGDIRDKRGYYRNFVSDTIKIFLDNGMKLYNEAILIKGDGSMPMRIRRQFGKTRKMGKTHQNILIFCNGNPNESGVFDCENYGADINNYINNNCGKLALEHQKVLVFSKGDAKEASRDIPLPETEEDLIDFDNFDLVGQLIDAQINGEDNKGGENDG